MRFDLASVLSAAQSITPAGNRTADVNGSAATVGPELGAAVIINVGAYTDGTHEFIIQEQDTGGSWAAVADKDLVGSEPTVSASGDADATHVIGYIGKKEQIRVTTSTSGTTTGAEYSAVVALREKRPSA